MNGITKDIIFNYFSGQASALQKRMIKEWLDQQENIEIYYEWMEEWEILHPQFEPDFENAFSAFKEKIRQDIRSGEKHPEPIHRVTQKPSGNKAFLAIAATFLILLGFSIFKNDLIYQHFSSGLNEVRIVQLPDSSRIILNANSSISISRFFTLQKVRQVHLQGEAIFYVRHKINNQPFVVTTDRQLQVRVLGTEFDLYARKDSSRVFLNQGSIRLSSAESNIKPFLMKPGDLVKINSSNKIQFNPHQHYWQFRAWQNHKFAFDHTSLFDIARMLNEQFGENVVIPDSTLGKRVISGSYKWDKENDILSTLSIMMN
ncbi:MAG: FecR domain-containing protein, partial [Chitinophagaceae bacterium]